jgi:hypothetical protein
LIQDNTSDRKMSRNTRSTYQTAPENQDLDASSATVLPPIVLTSSTHEYKPITLEKKADYRNWCRQIKLRLQARDLWWALNFEDDKVDIRRNDEDMPEYLKNSLEPGDEIVSPKRTANSWRAADQAAIQVIVFSISQALQTSVASVNGARRTWDMLESILTEGGRQNLWHHLDRMDEAAEKRHPSIKAKYLRIQEIDLELRLGGLVGINNAGLGKDKGKETGQNGEGTGCHEPQLIRFLIKNLGPQYDTTIQLIRDNETISLKETFEKIQARETSLANEKSNAQSFQARERGRGRSRGGRGNRAKGDSSNRSRDEGSRPPAKSNAKTVCYGCNKLGHFARHCPERKSTARLAIEFPTQSDSSPDLA